MKIAFVQQPFDSALPQIRNSLGTMTYEMASRLPESCTVRIYQPRLPKRPARSAQHGKLTYRFFDAPGDALQQSDYGDQLQHVRTQRTPYFSQADYCEEYFEAIARAIQQDQCEIVHIYNFAQAATRVRHHNPKARIVLHMKSDWLVELNEPLIRQHLADVDLILGPSDYIRDNIRRRFPGMQDRCQTLYGGVDLQTFTQPDLPRSLRRQSASKLLYCGRLSPEKGVHVLFDAFRQLVDRGTQAELQVIGPAAVPPPDFIPVISQDHTIREMEPLYQPGKYVEFLRTKVPERIGTRMSNKTVATQQMPAIYQQADLLVFPSVWDEPFSFPIVEAMATGLPVIATRSGVAPEIVEDGHNGLLVPKGDAKAFADAVVRLVENDELRKKCNVAARTTAEKFSWDMIVDQLLSHYQGLLAKA